MDEIERNSTVNLDHFDTDVGLRSSTGFAGLKNFGATCYMNSVIQQLYMIPDLRYGVLASEVNTGKLFCSKFNHKYYL
jgi:ubiquitin C-terminal hydrolase